MTPHRIDRKKYKRLQAEGEAARSQINAWHRQVADENLDHSARLNRVYGRGTGLYGVSLDDLLLWEPSVLTQAGVRREDVLRAVESAADLADLRERVKAAVDVANQKAHLAGRLAAWVSSNPVEWL